MEEAGLIGTAGQTINSNLQAFQGALRQAGLNSLGGLVTHKLFV